MTALRGPAVSRAVARCGIHPKKFWLLMDLFGAISERGEMMDQLGRNGVALQTAALFYAIFSLLLSFIMVVAHARPPAHLLVFLVFTGVLFTSVLLSEAGNSLINPAEGLVLAHQPIDGATYTAAKLSHLFRIVLFLTPALNGIPALAGLLLPGARWFYPFEHLAATMALGGVVALLCCAAFGWLMRFIPPQRLKAVGQFAGAAPFFGMMWMGQLERAFRKAPWWALLPRSGAGRWAVGVAAASAIVAAVVLGIRSLSADYLVRVSAMMHGGARGGAKSRLSAGASLAARLGGGQGARAGFVFVSRLARRDWNFRRQIFVGVAPLLIVNGGAVIKGWKHDPFAADFSMIHLAPHAVGMLLLVVSSMLPFGSDYKGAWVFSLAAVRAIRGFATGVYAVLAQVVVATHIAMAPFLVWRWGAPHAALFVAYSVAASLLYVGVGVWLMGAIPFSRQPDPKRASLTLPILLAALAAMGIAVAVQHFVLFRSEIAVTVAVVATAAGAWAVGRGSTAALADAMTYQLAEAAGDGSRLYQEID